MNFAKPLEKFCRTNLFKFPNVAVKKTEVFVDLSNSIFDAHLCMSLISHKETLCKVSDQMEKVSRSNLFEFFSL